jgi:2-C-methyl-D-erythritol 4-phosphate cytidylyltransferase/2-C-methyl-D-erythritol 2,4-cyclodiphosphate synthase
MSKPADKTAVIIVAAGSGSRASNGLGRPKQFRSIGGRPMLGVTLDAFLTFPGIDRVVTVINPDFATDYAAAANGCVDPARLLQPVSGGATRQASVKAGLDALAGDPPDFVLIHDAARPFVSHAILDRAILALRADPAVLVAVPVVDTLKRANDAGYVTETVPRAGLWGAQTPQGFHFAAIHAAHAAAVKAGRSDFTDDAAVAEWAGMKVVLVEGDPINTKVTTSADLVGADRQAYMRQMLELADVRVGNGYDVHSFVPGDHIMLGGVRIEHGARLNGHSDSDVALHAITDAILGAIGEGDIGAHFPPSEERWRGVASSVFVRDAVARVTARNGIVAHIDLSIIAEAPKIGPHRDAMRAAIADIIGIDIDRVGVKATTNEKLGFIGRREGIAAIATATVRLPFGRPRAL